LSRPPKLPYATPEETLEAISRPAYDVIEHSRFREPVLMLDGSHDPACPCDECRCPKCDRRGGRTNCETCRILNAPPHERGPYPTYWDNGPSYNPRKGENWIGPLRRNDQTLGYVAPERPKCAKCGLTIEASLSRVGDGWECSNKDYCRLEVASQARLRLVKPEQP
jgi:hypothetical protein